MMVAEREPLLNGNMLAYVLVSLLLIAFVVIVVLVCRQKNRTGVCLHSTSMHACIINSTVLNNIQIWTAIFSMSSVTESHQVFGSPHFYNFFNLQRHVTLDPVNIMSSFPSTRPNHLNLRFLVIRLTSSNLQNLSFSFNLLLPTHLG